MLDLLPIGSVVLLKEGTKKLMIYGRKQQRQDTGEMFDYIGCFYPEGYLTPELTFLFNHESITKVFFTGFSNEEDKEFLKSLEDYLNKQGKH